MGVAIEMARMTQTVAQNIANNTDTTVGFDTLAIDTTGGRMPNLGSNQLTCSTAGSYLVTASFRFAAQNSSYSHFEANGVQHLLPNATNVDMSVFTIPATGQWNLTGSVAFNNTSIGTPNYGEYIWIEQNGTTVVEQNVITTGGWWTYSNVATNLLCTIGDTVKLRAFQDSTSSGGINTSVVGFISDFRGQLINGSERYVTILKNGSLSNRIASANMATITTPGALSVSAIVSLASNDYITLSAYQLSGGPLASDVQFNDINLSMALLSPA